MIAKLRLADAAAAIAGLALLVGSLLPQFGAPYTAYNELVINVLVGTYLLGILAAAVSVAASLGILPARLPWQSWAAGAAAAVLLNAIFGAMALSYLAAHFLRPGIGLGSGVYVGIVAAVVLFVSVGLRPVIPSLRQPVPGPSRERVGGPPAAAASGSLGPDPAPASWPTAERPVSPSDTRSGSWSPTPGSPSPDPTSPAEATSPESVVAIPRPSRPDSTAGSPGPPIPDPTAGSTRAPRPEPTAGFTRRPASDLESTTRFSPPPEPETATVFPTATVPEATTRSSAPPPTEAATRSSAPPPAEAATRSSAPPPAEAATMSPAPAAPEPGRRVPSPATAFAPFWAAVPTPRPLYRLDDPSAVAGVLHPGTWYAAVAPHARGLVVILSTGETGVLVEVADVFRG